MNTVEKVLMKYKIVQKVDKGFEVSKPSDLREWAKSHGTELKELSPRRRSALREELRDAPGLVGFYGPMYDGEVDGVPVIRYEDSDTFNEIST